MTTTKLLYVYKGRNSPHKFTVNYESAPMPFISNGVTMIGVVIDGTEYNTSDYVNYNDVGLVTLTLGSIPTPPDLKSTIRLVMYSPEYPLGLPLITEKTDYQLQIEFI